MKTSVALYHLSQLSELLEHHRGQRQYFDQVILHLKGLSKTGTITLEELAREAGLVGRLCQCPFQLCLVWDVLMPENEFREKQQLWQRAQKLFSKTVIWRVTDLGALHFLLTYQPSVQLEIDATTGFHNSMALKTLHEFTRANCQKIILSLELPEQELREIHDQINLASEILVLGPIPLFYTPRHLLQRYGASHAVGKSEETSHSGFMIEDNPQGTFMWLPKHLFLLDHLDEIAKAGVSWIRFDCSLEMALAASQVVRAFNDGRIDWKEQALLLKKQYQHPTIKGFFKANRTNLLFPKLKNQRLRTMQAPHLGEILDLEKDHFMVARLLQIIKIGDSLNLHTPEGRVRPFKIKFLRNSIGQELEQAGVGEVVLIPHVSGACVGSILSFS